MKKVDLEKEFDILRRIKRARIPICKSGYMRKPPTFTIRQDFESHSRIFELDLGVGLILPLTIIPDAARFALSGFYLELDRWEDPPFCPLEKVENLGGERYGFNGRPDLKFKPNEALNGLITQGKFLPRGRPVSGVLLASCPEPIPVEIQNGEVLAGAIKMFDQFEHVYSAEISLRVEREAERRKIVGGAGESSTSREPKRVHQIFKADSWTAEAPEASNRNTANSDSIIEK